MNYGLKNQTIEKIKEVFSHHPRIEKVVLYGSRAKGNFKTGSDIELTLFGSSLDFPLLLRVEEDLEKLDLPYTFDLSIHRNIKNKNLLDHISRVGTTFYSKESP